MAANTALIKATCDRTESIGSRDGSPSWLRSVVNAGYRLTIQIRLIEVRRRWRSWGRLRQFIWGDSVRQRGAQRQADARGGPSIPGTAQPNGEGRAFTLRVSSARLWIRLGSSSLAVRCVRFWDEVPDPPPSATCWAAARCSWSSGSRPC